MKMILAICMAVAMGATGLLLNGHFADVRAGKHANPGQGTAKTHASGR